MPEILIKGGRVVDPSQGINDKADILIRDGKIAVVGGDAAGQASAEAEVFDATGLTVVPGLIDIHVHLREPGMEQQETIASGVAAAVAGGFTSIASMPNTDPAIDSESSIRFVIEEAKKAGLANVFPVGAITSGRKGEELAEMGQMADAGAVAFTDDGTAVPTAGLLRRAMSYAKMLDRPIMEHCEDLSLASGAMNEGFVSTTLGLPGIPNEAEEIIVARDVALARLTGASLHIQHVSTRGSVAIIRKAKAEGINVTGEVTPHHLTLTDEAVRGYNPNYKMNPPLRNVNDVNACVEGLADGTIDAIASDHAPHLTSDKELEFQFAPCGIIGLETTIGVLMTDLVHAGKLTFERMISALTSVPAGIIGIDRGTLEVGKIADVTIIDTEREWVVNAEDFRSKSVNCPFIGRTLKGRPVATIISGDIVYREEISR